VPERIASLEFWRSRVSWRTAVIVVAVCAFAVRVLIMALSNGGNDLRIYTYFSHLPLDGFNPFDAPPGGLFPPHQSDQPPLEVAIYAGLLHLHDSPTTLRVLFALADVGVILLMGFWFPRPRRWRAWFIAFYAFNPFVLLAWTVFAEDKTLLFLGIVLWIGALERDRQWGAWAAASALAAFKYLGAFALPALALHSYRTRGSWVLRPIAVFVTVVLLSTLPWFPDSLDAWAHRNTRLSIDPPIHASPTLVLARLGLYAPIEAKILTALAIVAVLALFWARRIDIREALIWSLFAGYIFLPDDPFGRLLLITLPFMLILEYSAARWLAIWVVSSILAVAGAIAVRGVPGALSALAGPLEAIFGRESTVQHVLWMNVLPLLILAFYLADRKRGRAPWGAGDGRGVVRPQQPRNEPTAA
jgi:hypothetical protein